VSCRKYGRRAEMLFPRYRTSLDDESVWRSAALARALKRKHIEDRMFILNDDGDIPIRDVVVATGVRRAAKRAR